METNLYKYYKTNVIPEMMKEFGYKNILQVPKIKQVVINVGVGKHVKDTNYIERVEKNLAVISGQKPIRTKAKKAISNFKIREGMDIGVVVTMHGVKMYAFLEKLLSITLPRTRDFRGISPKSFDKLGNYSFGLKENVAFPEIQAGDQENNHCLQIVVTTTAKNKKEGYALLEKMGFPFTK